MRTAERAVTKTKLREIQSRMRVQFRGEAFHGLLLSDDEPGRNCKEILKLPGGDSHGSSYRPPCLSSFSVALWLVLRIHIPAGFEGVCPGQVLPESTEP